MKIYFLLLALTISAQFQCVSGLKLVNNGYEDLYVVIGETVPESDELLDRIKTIFVEASALLFSATHRRTYFKSVKVIVPKTWQKKDIYTSVSGFASSTSHIKVGNTAMVMPVTAGSETCGQEGLYTYLPYKEFVLNYTVTPWGNHASVIVHEWGHLRWGLKDEYPTIIQGASKDIGLIRVNGAGGNIVQTDGVTVNFYQGDGEWKPVGCVRDLEGYATTARCTSDITSGTCDLQNSGVMIDCKFCPEMTQTVNASIMSYQYIPSVLEFCDKDDPQTPEYKRHNSEATNAQNTHCDYKSSWEIMREHMDFKGGNNPPLDEEIPPSTEFQFLQNFGRFIVFVLDISGSMTGQRIDFLYKTARYIITNRLPLGSWTSIITFDTDSEVRSNLTQVDSDTAREILVSRLPNTTRGLTCIPCGLDTALEVLRGFSMLHTTEESEIILISDGRNNQGSLENATQNCVNAGVVIHSILVTEAADQVLIDLATRTRGRFLDNDAEDLDSLIAVFSEIISSGPNLDSDSSVTVKNEHITTIQNVSSNVSFTIEDGMGKDTTVSVISNVRSDLGMLLTGPLNTSLADAAIQSNTLSITVPGTSETGEYKAEITSATDLNLTAIVTTKPVSANAEVVRAVVKLSSHTLNFNDTRNLPILYVYLKKGELPVKKATVEAVVQDPEGKETCILNPKDNGVAPDTKSDDGTYSAVLLRKCQNGNGRHSTQVNIKGDQETVVTSYTLSGAAFIDVDANVAQDTPTGNFERVAMADAYTVSNFDPDVNDTDETPPGRITDVQVIDIQSGIPSISLTRNYTITWTAPGDDFGEGQASAYDMRISDDQSSLRHDFMNAERLTVSGSDMSPNVSGKVERLQVVVSSNDEFTATTYFAIVAIDAAGNRGDVSNIVPITIGLTSQFEVIEEECTDDCYAIVKDCGRSLTISNGHVNLTNVLTTAGNSVPLICDVGYIQNGGSSIECLENGTWSQDVRCKIVDCGDPDIDNGGLQAGSETVYNGSATVECIVGYEGGGTATCLVTGSWDTLPTCSPVDCGSLSNPAGATVNTSAGTTYQSVATFTCNTGYIMNGVLTSTCQANGQWDNTDPVCTIQNCGTLPGPSNGEVSLPSATTYGETATYTCGKGYDLTGVASRTCQSDATWSDSAPTCDIKDCGVLVAPINGTIDTASGTTYGEMATYSCDTGYNIVGTTQRTCQADGSWNGSPPTCGIANCGVLSNPAGATVNTSAGTTYLSVATFTCNTGYIMNGLSTSTCLANGQWDNTDPVCTIQNCGTIPDPPNGEVSFPRGTIYGETATYTCDTGYDLTGVASRTCLSDATWSDSAPTCDIKDCGPLTDPAHGSVSAPLTHYTSVATYTCHSLWRLNGSDTLVCEADGNWYPDPPSCDEIDCPALTPPTDGSLSTGAVYVGTSVIVSCDTGYTLFGDGLIQCETGGTWDTSVGTCRRDCPVLTPPKNGDLSTIDVAEGTVVNITCDTAYTLEGAYQVTCLPGGSWNDVLPDCTEDCQPLTIPDHGSISTNSLSQGTVVSVECESGYTLFGASAVQCRTDATWNHAEPTCKLDCPSLSPPHNGKIDTLILSQGTVVTFSCNAGYTLFGDHQLTCQVDSTWDLPDPLCKQDCPALTHPTNGFFDTLEHRQTTIATAFCNDGYSLFGATSLTCKSDSTWDLPMPECRENCPGLTPPRDGTINSTDVKKETKVGVDCDAGYTLFGASLLICQSNATWDNPVPECRQDNVTKAKDQMRIKNIVAITGSCIGLVFMVITGALILTVIRTSKKRNLRKGHIREIPPDYTMDDSLEEVGNSANAFHGWYIYSKRGFEYLNPDWNLRDRPQPPDKHDIFHRYF